MNEPGTAQPLEASEDAGKRRAWGYGVATVAGSGEVLDTWYPVPRLGPAPRRHGESHAPVDLSALAGEDPVRGVRTEIVRTEIDLDAPPEGTCDAYLRLHLLSHRLVVPHGLDLTGVFGVLATVVWTDRGPCPVEDFEGVRLRARAGGTGRITVWGIDKFPRMTDYVVPDRVRVADADRVRLGAHLAPGTTVMHEGFVNFNAGTLGTSMVEGRISAGVVVGDGSDVGGGASVMGTLSGGGKEIVSIGRRSLLGANSGLGISLGDDCVVEAGCYVTAGAKVRAWDGTVRKAAEFSGVSGLLFRRNSLTGALEVLPRRGDGVRLNEALHSRN